MKRLVYICLVFFSSSIFSHDTELFREHIQLFEQLSGKRVNIKFYLYEFEDEIAGQCLTLFGKPVRVNIGTIFYKTYGDNYYAVQQLIFHELGHCILGLKHNDNYFTHKGVYIPASIMNSYIFGYLEVYEKFNDYYLDELFN